MSGPKISVYELDEIRRKQVTEERRRRRLELEKQRERMEEVTGARTQLQREKERLQKYELVARDGRKWLEDATLSVQLEKLREKIDAELAVLKSVREKKQISDMERELKRSAALMKELELDRQSLDACSEKLETRLREQLDASAAELFRELRQTEKTEQNRSGPEIEKDRLDEQIRHYLDMEQLPISLRQELIQKQIRLADPAVLPMLHSFSEVELRPILKQCSSFAALWDEIGAEYTQLCRRCEVLAEEVGEEVHISAFSREAVSRLKEAVAAMDARAQERAEKAYVEQAMAEVMEEMGYHIRGDRTVRKRSGKQFRNELYDFGGDTAISVTYHEDGQVAMEVGKLDSCDRLPSESEVDALENRMEGFCSSFHRIEERLKEKGVRLGERVALYPPSGEFAQVINLCDFEVIHREDRRRAKEKANYTRNAE